MEKAVRLLLYCAAMVDERGVDSVVVLLLLLLLLLEGGGRNSAVGSIVSHHPPSGRVTRHGHHWSARPMARRQFVGRLALATASGGVSAQRGHSAQWKVSVPVKTTHGGGGGYVHRAKTADWDSTLAFSV